MVHFFKKTTIILFLVHDKNLNTFKFIVCFCCCFNKEWTIILIMNLLKIMSNKVNLLRPILFTMDLKHLLTGILIQMQILKNKVTLKFLPILRLMFL